MSILLANLYVMRAAAPHLYDPASVPRREHVIVPGAAIRSGRPSGVLAARLQTAAELVSRGAARAAIVSGRAAPGADEPRVMANYLMELGLLKEQIVLDNEGPRTLATFVSARRLGVTDAIVVTNAFHLSRAVFLARRLGLDAVGVAATDPGFSRRLRAKWAAREAFARARAVVDVALSESARGW